MKKTFLKSIVAALFLGCVWSNTSAGEIPVYTKEICLADAYVPIDPVQERSLLPYCQAYQYDNQIEVIFNKYIGQATVCICNQYGRVISTAYADSEYGNTLCLQLPVSKGVYYLHIIGTAGYQSEGSFTIE